MAGGDLNSLVAGLPGWAFAFVLVLSRVGAAVMLMPGLGEAEPPRMLRAGLAFAMTMLLLPLVAPLLPPTPVDAWSGAGMVVAELLDGLFLGWLARLVALALPMAGQLISYMLGLSSVLTPDAVFNAQGTVMSRAFGLVAPVILLGTGLYAVPISALAGSYQVLPPGALLPSGDTAETVVRAVGASFGLALRLASPFLLASVVWQVGLGLLARLVPKLQVYFVAQPAQILGGLLLLTALCIGMLDSWSEAARAALASLPGL